MTIQGTSQTDVVSFRRTVFILVTWQQSKEALPKYETQVQLFFFRRLRPVILDIGVSNP